MPQGRYCIMVVDSQLAVRMLICSQLHDLGYDALACAPNGTAVLARFKLEPIDAVLIDVESTTCGGMEALRALRTDPDLRHLPVVLITARAELETVSAGLALGVSGCLIKPPSTKALGASLRRALLGGLDVGSAAGRTRY